MHSEEITETRKDRVLSVLGEIRKMGTKHCPLISVLEIRHNCFHYKNSPREEHPQGGPGWWECWWMSNMTSIY